jgi:hypothetical protein
MSDLQNQLEQLIQLAVDKIGYQCTMIVTIKYKYNHEKDYRIANEILRPANGDWEWLSDWYEGEEDIQYVGIMPVDCVTTLTKEELENETEI